MPPSLTVAITAFRETTRRGGKQIKDAIASAASSPLVSEVVVVDDASEDFNQLANLIEGMPKTILFCNPENRGVLANKAESVFRSTGEWVQLCDSDNLMRTDFFDAISKRATWDKTQWICPSFAAPEFNYQHLSGVYCLESMPSFLQRPLAECCLNTGNQCVHRESFLELFGRYRTVDSHLKQPDYFGTHGADRLKWRQVYDAADSYFLNKTWLLNGGELHIVQGLRYEHYWTRGSESNYVRAPSEKEKLPPIYRRELIAAARSLP